MPGMNLSIRPVSLSDEARWRALFDAYLDFYETKLDASTIDAAWQRLTAVPAEIRGLVAEADGEIVGFAHFHFQVTTWCDQGTCDLEDLYVDPAHRGSGACRSLIEAIRSEAEARACSELFWITRASNATAQRLYDRVATKTDFLRYEISISGG